MSAVDSVSQWQQTVKLNLLRPKRWDCRAGRWRWPAVAARRSDRVAGPGGASQAGQRAAADGAAVGQLARPDAVAAMLRLTRSIPRDRGGRKLLLLILDETPKADHLRCMRLSVAYHKRTVTLLGVCYRPNHPPMPMPRLLRRMLRRMLREVAARVPRRMPP